MADEIQTAYPTGRCYCGCGAAIPPTKFFVNGHDRAAEARVIRERYGSAGGSHTANFVLAHGYGPNRGPKETSDG